MRALAHSSRSSTLFLALLLVWLPTGSAQTYKVLNGLSCPTSGCGNQQAVPLTQGRDGNLYGQSYSGGTNNSGAIWRVSPTGVVKAIWSFSGTDINNVHGGLALGLDGNFYGTFAYGGTYGTGYLFKITPGGVLTILKSFNDCVDGGFPYTPPTLGPDGNFYGYVIDCTPHFYKITPSGTYTAITTTAPVNPGPLLLASDGNFYGVSSNGGSANLGSVFKVTPAGHLTILHSFTGPDGENPLGNLVQGTDGFLYGTTPYTSINGFEGTIFKISTSGKFTILHTLASGAEGSNMWSGVVAASDGNFYGNTTNGGTYNFGTVFQMTPAGKLTVLHNIGGSACDSGNAWLPLSQRSDGTLYGVTNLETSCTDGNIYTLTSAAFKPAVSVQNYSAHAGQTINILGSAFTGATAVKFGSVPATSFKVVGGNYVTAVVPPTAITGAVSVTTPSRTVTTPRVFKVSPSVTSFTPTSGSAGTPVTLTGTGFTGATKVAVGGVAATQFTVNSVTKITVTVPSGAKTGAVAVTTAGGTGSKATFTVN